MKYLRNAFDLYINSSIHVSLAVVAFSLITAFSCQISPDLDLCFFIFFASITGYNFVKYAGIAKLHHASLTANLRYIQIFSLFSFLAMLYFIFQLDYEVLFAAGVLGVLTLLYGVPVLAGKKSLRSVPGLKIFVIAVVWGGVSVLLPLINKTYILNIEVIVDFLQRILFVVVLTLPFEIRDLNYDQKSLETIPQKLGVRGTRFFGSILIFIILGMELFQATFSSTQFIALFLSLVLLEVMLWKSSRKQKKYFCSFWVEAIPLFYLGIFALLRHYL